MNEKIQSRWKPGQSGNPKGRARNSGTVAQLRNSIEQHVPAIIEALVALAKIGDPQASRLLLERVVPAVKPIELAVILKLPKDGTLTEKAEAVLAAAADGTLAPTQAAQLLTALATLAKVTEIDELASRIAKLEEKHHGAP